MECNENLIEIPTMMLSRVSIEIVYGETENLFALDLVYRGDGIVFSGLHYRGELCTGVRMRCN